MIIFPAIDLKDGKCVRLLQGKAQDQTVYSNDPVKTALRWQTEGAEFLHIVDLDGAFTGTGTNFGVVQGIVGAIQIPVQLGGGIRNMEQLENRLEMGVARCILGTSAISDPEFVKAAAKKYPGRVVAGIDAHGSRVAVRGWVDSVDISPIELGQRLYDIGIQIAVYTDIAKDGMLVGPNIKASVKMQQQTKLKIIASGGVSSKEDIRKLYEAGMYGAITGKALYDGRLTLADAFAACK